MRVACVGWSIPRWSHKRVNQEVALLRERIVRDGPHGTLRVSAHCGRQESDVTMRTLRCSESETRVRTA